LFEFMNCRHNKALVRRLLQIVINRRQVNRLGEFLAPGVRDRFSIRGIAGYRKHVETFLHCYPDLHMTIRGQVAERDWVVTWFDAVGTHQGAWQGIQPTGKQLRLNGVNIYRIRNGRIVEQWGAANTLEALLELGVVRWVKRSRRRLNARKRDPHFRRVSTALNAIIRSQTR
jgi:predicted ester cyclase